MLRKISLRRVQLRVGETNVPKYPGDTVQAVITFEHKGAAELIDVGIGLAPHTFPGNNDVQWWVDQGGLSREMNDDSDWIPYTETVTGVVPSTLAAGTYDVLKWIQKAGGPRDKGGNGFLEADWDQNSYDVITESHFQGLVATYS